MASNQDIKTIRQNMLKSNQKRFKNKKGQWVNFDSSDCLDIIEYTDGIVESINSGKQKALEIIGLMAEGYAKRLCPVDTGRLRNSITHTIDSDAAYIGTNVEYARHVEFGTAKRNPKPFLRPAAADHMQQYVSILKKCFSED